MASEKSPVHAADNAATERSERHTHTHTRSESSLIRRRTIGDSIAG